MSLRYSIDDAEKRGWITEAEAKQQRAAAKQEPREIVGGVRKKRTPEKGKNTASSPLNFCSVDGDTPQQKLWIYCVKRWPELLHGGGLIWELNGAVPGRRYSIDIAFPLHNLAIECDGWEYHGKHLKDFKRDREKDRALTLNGWRTLRYFASEIHQDRERIINEISIVLSMIDNGSPIEVCDESSAK